MKLQAIQFTDSGYNRYAKWRMKYLLPLYLGLSVLLIGSFILAAIPDDDPGIFGISCLVLWLVVSVLTLLAVPFLRKKEIRWELAQYDFDWQRLPDEAVYYYEGKDFFVRFLPNLLSHNDSKYSYDEVLFTILTYNYKQHILIYLQLEHENGRIRIPLSTEILHMIYQYDLELENPEDLEYILQNKEDAFKKIYNSGSIHGIRHYLEQPQY